MAWCLSLVERRVCAFSKCYRMSVAWEKDESQYLSKPVLETKVLCRYLRQSALDGGFIKKKMGSLRKDFVWYDSYSLSQRFNSLKELYFSNLSYSLEWVRMTFSVGHSLLHIYWRWHAYLSFAAEIESKMKRRGVF